MPLLRRPDGAEIFWEERGEGPLVVMATQFFGYPELLEGLTDDLVADHRVVTYHLRGTGRSTRTGPYDMPTDAADLCALTDEVEGPAVIVAMGDGANRAVRAAAARPDLVRDVVSPGGNPLGRNATRGTEALAASESVLEALVGLLDTDYRAALRTMVDTANPQLDEESRRERVDRTVDHCPHEAAAPRLRAWIDDDAGDEARALGDRLWILEHGKNPWFPIEVVRQTRELLPEAHVEEVVDGPLSRPDITAAVVRGLTSSARAVPASDRGEQSL
jgi:pimeloyl-ACP methyl ester carboxylesterase